MTNFGNYQVIYSDNSYSNITFPDIVIDNVSNKDNYYSFTEAIYTIGSNGQVYLFGGSAVGGYGNDTYNVDQGDYASIYDGSNSPNDSLKIDDYSYNLVFIAAIENHILLRTSNTYIVINHGLTNHGLIENIEFKDIKLNYLNTESTAAFVNNYQYLFNNFWQQNYDAGFLNSPPIAQPTLLDLYNAGITTNIPSISGYNTYAEIIDFINNDLPNLVSLSEASSYKYLASNTDLIFAFGSDINSASNHYFLLGISENRPKDSFDAWKYLASNTDLISAFGSNTDLATKHFVEQGFAEGRVASSFDVNQYLTNYPDLVIAFNNNSSLAIEHYVTNGFSEGRTDSSSDSGSGSGSSSESSSNLTDLQAYNYIAGNPDLISAFGIDIEAAKSHYTNNGKAEGRSLDSFSAPNYLAKYSDLSAVFGADQTLALKHYIEDGYNEGRTDTLVDSGSGTGSSSGGSSNLTDFQALNYIASYGDLINAFGTDTASAKSHYSNNGKSEGRMLDDFDEWGYLASNNDLLTTFGSNTTEAVKHYISFGYSQGRSSSSFDAQSYLNSYADLRNAFGNDKELAIKHYVENGFREGRGF